MIHRLFPAWDGLHHAALTGEPAFNKIFKQPLFDYVGTHPELAPIFDAGMTAFHGHETGAMLEAYNFTAIQVLADIGGGNGSLIGSVLRRYPIPNNGRLLVIESVVPTGDEPSLAKDFDIAMLTFPGGIERTAEEYKLLLEKAGFRLSSITPTASSVSVIEGKPR